MQIGHDLLRYNIQYPRTVVLWASLTQIVIFYGLYSYGIYPREYILQKSTTAKKPNKPTLHKNCNDSDETGVSLPILSILKWEKLSLMMKV